MAGLEALMIGVSGMRGTVGGTLTPEVVMRMASATAVWLTSQGAPKNGQFYRVVFGRDGRPSGCWVRDAAISALTASGVGVIDLDIVTTPGVAIMVKHLQADAGMVCTASHNPIQWNGLKVLSGKGVAPPAAEAARLVELYEKSSSQFVRVDKIIQPSKDGQTHAVHVDLVLRQVDVLGVAAKRFKVVLDSVNGAGSVATSMMLSKLGCEVIHLHGTPNGQFPHPPEPTAENLTELCDAVKKHGAAVGFAQDPDADRLALVDENGKYIGEEYSLALVAKLLLGKKGGAGGGIAVTNLSTSRMLDDIAAASGGKVLRTPVGEANVADVMLSSGAVVGGEGNGGVIDPRVVAGRDSLVGMAYVLQLMAQTGKKVSELVGEIPRYEILKTKFDCRREDAVRAVAAVAEVAGKTGGRVDKQDGIRIDWDADRSWVHVRPSNTEPIMRIIAEAPTSDLAASRVEDLKKIVAKALG